MFKTSWSYAGNYNLTDAGRFTETAGSSWLTWTDDSSDTTRGNITALAIAPTTGGSGGKVFIYNDQGSGYAPGWREVWTSTSDGSGSGLDADLLDGQHASAFQAAGTYNTIIGTDSDINTSGCQVVDQLVMTDGVITSHSVRNLTLANLGYTGATNANYITNNNQLTNGAGYTTCTGNVSTSGNQSIAGVKSFSDKIGADGGIDGLTLANGGITGSNFNISGVNQLSINDPGEGILFGGGTNSVHLLAIDDATDNIMNFCGATELRVAGNKVWTAANDGPGSGLNADCLDDAQLCSNASTSTVVQRTGNGYICANYFHTAPNDVSSNISKILIECGNDGFMRHGTASGVRSFLNVADGATTCTGTVTSITVNTAAGLDGAGTITSSGTLNLSLDLSELTDMTGGIDTAVDEIILLDNGAERRKRFAEIFGSNAYNSTTIPTNNNQLTNGAGYITSSGTANNSTCAGGLAVHTGRNNVANRIVRTDSNGYIQAGWINTTSGAQTTQSFDRIYASTDSYIRYYSPACFGIQIGQYINYNCLASKPTIPTNNNQLTNGNGYTTCTGNLCGSTAQCIFDSVYNFCIGPNAGEDFTSGSNNTLIGKCAGRCITTGAHNVSIGSRAGEKNCVKSYNVSLGYQAGFCGQGCGSTAIGQAALQNASSDNSVAIGKCTLYAASGNSNTAIGAQALQNMTSGQNNFGLGAIAGFALQTGNGNVFIGQDASRYQTSGDNVVAIGKRAGRCHSGGTRTVGNNNIYIGQDTKSSANSTSNEIVIGCGAVGCGSNKAMIGNSSVTVVCSNGSFSTVSDRRDKTCICDLEFGLDFIGNLKPKTFNMITDRSDPEGSISCKRHGFIAQDVIALEGDDPVITNNDNPDRLGYTGEHIIPILVKGMQEQQAIIDNLTARLEALEG